MWPKNLLKRIPHQMHQHEKELKSVNNRNYYADISTARYYQA